MQAEPLADHPGFKRRQAIKGGVHRLQVLDELKVAIGPARVGDDFLQSGQIAVVADAVVGRSLDHRAIQVLEPPGADAQPGGHLVGLPPCGCGPGPGWLGGRRAGPGSVSQVAQRSMELGLEDALR